MGEWAAALVGEVELGDRRLNRRLELIVEQLREHAQETITTVSLPQQKCV